MDDPRTTFRMLLLFPRAIAATFVVVVLPSLVTWAARSLDLVSSAALSIPLAALLTLVIYHYGGVFWEKRCGSNDVLFSDLMLWAWARRWLIERRIASSVVALALAPTSEPLQRSPLALDVDQRLALLKRLAVDLEARDPYTHGHSRRVARYSSLIASRMGLTRAEVAKIRGAAALHDIGKLNTPLEILHKPSRLTDPEFAQIKRHSVDGARMIALLVADEEMASIVRHHHERLDGTGYPSRLSSNEIPLGARIIAVADTFDAIVSRRPYRGAKPHTVALDILSTQSGTQLDPDAVKAFRGAYFGRGSLGSLVALSSAAERVASGLVSSATATAARAGGVAAVTAALGAGAVALPALRSPVAPTAAHRLTTIHPSAPSGAGRLRHSPASGTAGCCRLVSRRSGLTRTSLSASVTPAKPPAGRIASGSPAGTPTLSATRTATGSPSQPGPPAPSGTPNGSGGSGAVSIAAVVPAGGSGGPATAMTVRAGGSGAPSVSATLGVGGSGDPGVSASLNPAGAGHPVAGVTVGR